MALYQDQALRSRDRRSTKDLGSSSQGILDELLSGIDLLYDATAELGVNHLMADLAAARGIPYISISTTAGAWGGLIVRIRPDDTRGCWLCLQHRLMDETIPSPPMDPRGGVQPEGCANPTFTGTGFDVGEIALSGVRLAVSTPLRRCSSQLSKHRLGCGGTFAARYRWTTHPSSLGDSFSSTIR